MSVRAKFIVNSITEYESPKGARHIAMRPVHKYDLTKTPGICKQTCEENLIFGDATPSGEVKMTIVNPEAAKQFEIGKAYYVDFNPAPE